MKKDAGETRATMRPSVVEVYSKYESEAKRFESGDSRFEILQMGASNSIAYWVSLQP